MGNIAACKAGKGDDAISVGLQVVGTSMVISASFISTLGVNLQKWVCHPPFQNRKTLTLHVSKAHNKNRILKKENRKPMIQNWRWWCGLCGMVLASVFDLIALPFVPQSRVAALGAVTMVSNVIVTPLFLGEKAPAAS